MIRPPRAIRRVPLWREPLRRFAKRHAPRGPIEARVEGVAFSLHPRGNKTEFDIWYKERLPEAQERAFLSDHLQGGAFVDIGANVGLYSLALMKTDPAAMAYAFEPHPKMRARLSVNVARNELERRVHVRAEAIGPAGTLSLHEGGNAGRSSLLPFAGAHTAHSVPVRPLAEALASIEAAVTALKIDVEGYEDRALLPYFDAGAPQGWPAAIVLETAHRAAWRRDCLCELMALGYVLVQETAENACLRRPPGD